MKAKRVREILEFERGQDPRKVLFGIRPGEIIRRPSRMGSDIFVYLGKDKTKSIAPIKVFKLGSFSVNAYNKRYASLIFRLNSKPVYILEDTYRELTDNEKKLVKKSLEKKSYKKYLDILKEKIGVTPII
ncbi:MAG: hypothetical protein ACOC1K_07140 [Nanoarchaeota archaeon]